MSTPLASQPISRQQWKAAMEQLPDPADASGKIPAFFFAHGQPLLCYPEDARADGPFRALMSAGGPKSPLAKFLRDFGPFLVKKYKPKGIVVFSAHWETSKERLVTDYGDENPLWYDYFGFPEQMYQLNFNSRGDSALSARVVEAFKKAGLAARTSPRTESRGRDGRGISTAGFDHGVFVPFRLMFGDAFTEIPIVEVSIDQSLNPEKNWEIGKAVDALRSEGYLILSGGLTIHTFQDFSAFDEKTAKPIYHEFSAAILDAAQIESLDERKKAMIALTKHRGFRAAHPREDHFVPIYVAAGAGEQGQVRVLSGLYGAPTIAFGV